MKTLTAVPSSITGRPMLNPEQRERVKRGIPLSASSSKAPLRHDWRLHKHADYQRVYQASRKQFASLMTWFVAPQPPHQIPAHHIQEQGTAAPRIGITAGKVLGKAVERNRIKRRMRAAITANLDALHADVDVVLHPKRAVLTAPWNDLRNEVRRIFVKITEGREQQHNSNSLPEQKQSPQRGSK